MFIDIFGSCMCMELTWWPIEPKMTLFTFICRRNKHVRATSVPLPCFWSDSCNKNGYFSLVYLSVKLYMCDVCTFHPLREVTGNHLDLPMEKGNSYRDCHWRHLPYFLEISPWQDLISRCCTMWRHFEGGIYRDRYARAYTASVISLLLCVCAYIYCCRPRTMRWDFEGGVYWDELAEICGEMSRVVGFRGVARFRGNVVTDFADTRARVMLTRQAIEAAKWGDWNARQHAEYVLLIALVDCLL